MLYFGGFMTFPKIGSKGKSDYTFSEPKSLPNEFHLSDDGRFATKKLEVDGKNFKLIVPFPKNLKTEEEKINFLQTRYGEDKTSRLGKIARGAGLGSDENVASVAFKENKTGRLESAQARLRDGNHITYNKDYFNNLRKEYKSDSEKLDKLNKFESLVLGTNAVWTRAVPKKKELKRKEPETEPGKTKETDRPAKRPKVEHGKKAEVEVKPKRGAIKEETKESRLKQKLPPWEDSPPPLEDEIEEKAFLVEEKKQIEEEKPIEVEKQPIVEDDKELEGELKAGLQSLRNKEDVLFRILDRLFGRNDEIKGIRNDYIYESANNNYKNGTRNENKTGVIDDLLKKFKSVKTGYIDPYKFLDEKTRNNELNKLNKELNEIIDLRTDLIKKANDYENEYGATDVTADIIAPQLKYITENEKEDILKFLEEENG